MPNAAPIQAGFHTGEITPLYYGRVTDERYKVALAKCLNYLPTVQGGLIRRPGSYFVAPVADSSVVSRLMPFEFSTTQAYVIEWSNLKARFYRNNSAILESTVAITGATAANPVVVTAVAHGYKNGDHVEIAGVVGMTELNGRRYKVANVAANTMELQTLSGTNINGTSYTAYSSGGTVARVYTLYSRTITGATAANPVVITSAAHGYSNGEYVWIRDVAGMTELNNLPYIVNNVTTNTFELQNLDSVNVNGTGFTAYTSGGTASQTPYKEADLFRVKFTQSADVLYLTHPDYWPMKLTRTGHTAWVPSWLNFLDGPYLDQNVLNNGVRNTGLTITPSAATGNYITLTASSGLWLASDIGRLVRLKVGSDPWGYARIVDVDSSTVARANVLSTFTTASATVAWRLGTWCNRLGFPGSSVFHEDRLWFTGPSSFPQRLDGSKTGDYENFAPTDTAGAVVSSNGVSFSINANDVNVDRWMTTDEKGLLVGTTGGEWVARATSQSDSISAATPPSVKRASSYGSADIQPVQVGRATMYIQRSSKKLRELTYFNDVEGFQASDMTVLSQHITGNGITQLAYQKEPQSIIWGVRADGVLIGCTYERDLEKVNAGWSRHILGGEGNSAGDDAVVESVAAIPSSDGKSEELWLTVKRYINGETHRYVEYLTPLFDDLTNQADAFHVDSGLTYDSPVTITGATAANPVVITANSHGFSNGDTVRIVQVAGMTELNGETFTVANVAANTFELSGINGTSYGTYISGGQVRKEVTTISGLWHLIGQSVSILADGAVLPDVTVSALGVATLSVKSTVVQIGLGYVSDGQLPRLDAGSANGTSIGKTRRTHRVGFMLHRTLGFKIGSDFDELDEITFRTSSDEMTRAPALFSGILSETLPGDYDFENNICWRQDQPLPGMILAIMPQLVTQDRQ